MGGLGDVGEGEGEGEGEVGRGMRTEDVDAGVVRALRNLWWWVGEEELVQRLLCDGLVSFLFSLLDAFQFPSALLSFLCPFLSFDRSFDPSTFRPFRLSTFPPFFLLSLLPFFPFNLSPSDRLTHGARREWMHP